MKSRCLNPKATGAEYYHDRGITVCERWRIFENFLSDMGERPEGTTLDRMDNDGHYSCGQCPDCLLHGWALNAQWSTPKEQVHNRRERKLPTHCGKGHEMTPENSYLISSRGRARGCRQCRREATARYRSRTT